jgi:hypothetical protein
MSDHATKHQYHWRVSHTGGEDFGPPQASKEAAIAEAKAIGGALIAECLQQDFNLSLSGDDIFEVLAGKNEDRQNEDSEFIDATTAEIDDLGAMVTATIHAWVEKHQIDVTAWVFADTRNEEMIAPDQSEGRRNG